MRQAAMFNATFAKQQVGGGRCKLADGLTHGGQRRPNNAGERGIVKACDRQLFRNLNSAPMRYCENAGCHIVIGRKDGRRRILKRQELVSCGNTAFEIKQALGN